MYMVLVVVRLFEIERWVVLGYFVQFPVEVGPEFWGDDRVTVFGRKHYVVVTEIDTVTSASVLCGFRHRSMVSK